ncbi:Tubulin tyrosine ligase-like, member [Chamberlinius hualienensis]
MDNSRQWSFTGFIAGYRCTKTRPKLTIDTNISSNPAYQMSANNKSTINSNNNNRRRWWLPNIFRSIKIAPAKVAQEVEIKCELLDVEPPSKSPNLIIDNTGIVRGQCVSTTDHLLNFINPDELRSLSRLSQLSDVATPSVAPTPVKVQVKNLQQNTSNWTVANGPVPTFQTYGHNGSKLVEDILLSKGWINWPNVLQTEVKFVWGENLTQLKIWDFREGEQMFNHIPNTHLLSNKLCLLRCLQDYSALQIPSRKTGLRFHDFVPETYRLDLKQDQYMYSQRHKNGEVWICKPAMLNQGKGIFIARSYEELKEKLKVMETEEQVKTHFSKPTNVRVIQRYISAPLLLDGRKADIRAFMLIACAKPYVVLFHDGYVRLSCNQYDLDSNDLNTHLTNQVNYNFNFLPVLPIANKI